MVAEQKVFFFGVAQNLLSRRSFCVVTFGLLERLEEASAYGRASKFRCRTNIAGGKTCSAVQVQQTVDKR